MSDRIDATLKEAIDKWLQANRKKFWQREEAMLRSALADPECNEALKLLHQANVRISRMPTRTCIDPDEPCATLTDLESRLAAA